MVLGRNATQVCDLGPRSYFDHLVRKSLTPAEAVDALLLHSEHLFDMFVVRPRAIAHGRLPPEASPSLYHRYRLFRLFPEYQKAWIAANAADSSAGHRDVRDQLDSLGRRLEFICRALDEGLISALATPNNSSERRPAVSHRGVGAAHLGCA
jgi:hypothetical protein